MNSSLSWLGTLLAPRDFDVSPYFQIIKPNLTTEFDFPALNWYKPAVRNAQPALDLAFKQVQHKRQHKPTQYDL